MTIEGFSCALQGESLSNCTSTYFSQEESKPSRQIYYLQLKLCFFLIKLEKVKVNVAMPSEVSSVNVTPSLGKSSFDTVTKVLTWDVGHLDTQTHPSLRGSVNLLPLC